MLKMFYSGTYKVKHELINRENVLEMLKDDVRTKIVGDVSSTVYPSSGVVIKDNPNVMYVGGFYYEEKDPSRTVCENVVYEELKQIDKCDIIIANLTKYSAIATLSEIIYGAFKNKKTLIFCDPEVTSYEVEGEYWFPIIMVKQINPNVEIKFIESEEEIINYINNLKEEDL